MKLTRKQIREGLEQTPIEAVILGATNPTGIKLSPKEKRFAEEIAKGATKSDAYRVAYKPKGNRHTVNKRAYEVSKREDVAGYSEAIKAALEAQRFATPAHLRALTIHELTKGATDPEMPPAQRVKCLELLGKITEVSLFTERREIIKVSDSSAARETLLESIKAAITAQAQDVDYTDAEDLLAELTVSDGGGDSENLETDTLPAGHPPNAREDAPPPLHSNPHNGSPTNMEQNLPSTQTDVFTPEEG